MGLAGLGLIGSALVWSLAFPIAKKLWTSSFVLLTVGLDCLILAALTAVLDRRPPGAVTRFFEVFGRNPLVIYLFSEVFVVTLRQFQVAPGVDPYRWLGVNVFQAIAPGAPDTPAVRAAARVPDGGR